VRRRWPHLALALALVASALGADASADDPLGPEPPRARATNRPGLWSRIVDPNGDEVRTLVAKARRAMSQADEARTGDEDWALEQRARFYRDAYNLTTYARKLAPENGEALAAFARAAEELGRTAEAIEALERAAKLAGTERAQLEVVARLGAMHLRAGDTERAIRWLRLAQGPVPLHGDALEQTYAVIHLATALAARGEVAAGLHAIAAALPERPPGQVSHETTLLTFALAVLYDRDEQRAAAFEVLDHQQSILGAQYRPQIQLELARMRFWPPEDLHYYRALLYESVDQYVEARAEWALYAAAGQPVYRARALDHIAAIDAQRRANAGPKPPQQPAPSSAIPRRLPVP
jgi:tetratricopeptide (TPR) repeat protein